MSISQLGVRKQKTYTAANGPSNACVHTMAVNGFVYVFLHRRVGSAGNCQVGGPIIRWDGPLGNLDKTGYNQLAEYVIMTACSAVFASFGALFYQLLLLLSASITAAPLRRIPSWHKR